MTEPRATNDPLSKGHRTGSVLTPVTWYTGTVNAACFTCAAFLERDDPLRYVVVGTALLVVGVSIGLLLYFAVRHPMLLRNSVKR